MTRMYLLSLSYLHVDTSVYISASWRYFTSSVIYLSATLLRDKICLCNLNSQCYTIFRILCPNCLVTENACEIIHS